MMRRLGFLHSMVLLALSNSSATAAVIYVDATAPPGGNGSSWTTAYRVIDTAISACGASDEIHVAQGTYFTEFRVWSAGLLIAGGYAGLALPGNPDARDLSLYPTVFTGDRNGDDDGTSEHYADNAAVCLTAVAQPGNLSGIRFTGATTGALRMGERTSTIEDCWFIENPGSGVFVQTSGPGAILRRCTFDHNGHNGNPGVLFFGNVGALFENCTFEHHTLGPAIISNGSGQLVLVSCQFVENIAGAITAMNGTFRDCTFRNNQGWSGGAVSLSSGTLMNCAFEQNHALMSGGAVLAQDGLIFDGCVFRENSAVGAGGAIAVGTASITNCSFDANRASTGGAIDGVVRVAACSFVNNEAFGASLGDGGAINCGSGSDIRDSLFVRNYATGDGGACSAAGSTALVNCTFANNLAVFFGGGVFQSENPPIVIRNSIMWGNFAAYGGQAAIAPGAELRVAFSDVQGSRDGIYLDTDSRLVWGVGNVEVNPMFVDVLEDDFRLSGLSHCIDAGENAVVNTLTDLEGNERRLDDPDTPDTGLGSAPVVDMGAYEFDASSPNPGDCIGDTDNNRIVDLQDLATLLAHFGTTSGAEVSDGDTNGDGGVDLQDLANLLGHFGAECD